jgi:hydroxyacylglutathione hydrolase
MDNYAYILCDEATHTSAVIDPSEAEPVIKKCDELNLKLSFILNTHHHFDHVEGDLELADKYQAQIVCSQTDLSRIQGAAIGLKENDTFAIGDSTAQIIDTSAHTQGHIIYYFAQDKLLFTGDTLFNLCIGGLFEGTAEQMFKALSKIKALPDDVLFYPGHEYTMGGAKQALYYNAGNADIQAYLIKARQRLANGLPVAPITLGEEKRCNPYLEAATLEEFTRL